MGQKVHPIGFRLAVNKDWQSKWYAPQGEFADQLHADLKIRRYLDKRRDFSEAHQQGELGVRGPLDRIYESNRPVILDDGERRLRIAKQGSDSTVVWHPDSQLPGDTPAEAGLHFLCVEAACTRVDPVWLVPGAQHLLATTLTREDLAQ